MSRLVLISGPPRCGKSHAGRAIAMAFGGDHFAVSDYLKDYAHAYYNLPADTPTSAFEEVKDKPRPEFGGLTPREAYIFVSEKVIKPKYGKAWLGGLAAKRLASSLFPVSIVSGVGFMKEVTRLIDVAGAGNVLHLRISRADQGEPAPEDSRKKLVLEFRGVMEVDVENDFTPDFRPQVRTLVRDYFALEEMEDPFSQPDYMCEKPNQPMLQLDRN